MLIAFMISDARSVLMNSLPSDHTAELATTLHTAIIVPDVNTVTGLMAIEKKLLHNVLCLIFGNLLDLMNALLHAKSCTQ